MRKITLAVIALACLVLLSGSRRRAVRHPVPPPPAQLTLERSFVVTDRDIVSAFRLERVMDALAARSGVAGVTGEKLYRQLFDAQNLGPGLDASMPHCDDERTNGFPSMNGFPARCPTTEGGLATKPYVPDDFIPIGVVNRFDQADPSGSHCGQYRIVFASRAVTSREALHIIFEAVLPNPRPESGLAGCKPAAQFWAGLSGVDSMAERRARLERFFFDGLDGFAPVVHPDHFHRAQGGIRTLQDTRPESFRSFRQFRIVNEQGRVFFKPDVLENHAAAAFFDANDTSDRAQRLRAAFISNLGTLAIRDVNLFHARIPDEFLIGDPNPGRDSGQPISSLGATFLKSLSTSAGTKFSDDISAELQRLGSTLTPQDVMARMETQTCGACHFRGAPVGEGVIFPAALDGFQHITEDEMEDGEAGPQTRFAISPAMRNVFVPHRMQILRDFLTSGKAPVHSN
jgi:hypothetical protein